MLSVVIVQTKVISCKLCTQKLSQLWRNLAIFSGSSLCPDDWIHWSGNCYKLNQDLLTWEDAAKKCSEIGGHLASVHSDEENNFIFQTSNNAVTWLGGNDMSAEGSWIWSDGSSRSYTNWNSGQPNNNGNQDCQTIGYYAEKWDDDRCTVKRQSICKMRGEC